MVEPYPDACPEFRVVLPEIPPLREWAPYLEPATASNRYSNFGPVVRRFERELTVGFGSDETVCVSVSNATSGIAACLIAHNIIGKVICPAFTFPATASAILMARCSPLVVDVDPATLCLDPNKLEMALTAQKVEAVVLVIPYGLRVDITPHLALCELHGIRLIIDNASGLGTPRAQVEKSSSVDEVFSLHATKPFCVGEGGVIFSNRRNGERLESAINFGLCTHTRTGELAKPFWGINGKMSEVHAAIGLAVLDTIGDRVSRRQAAAATWFSALSEYQDQLLTKSVADGPWQFFPVAMPDSESATRLIDTAAEAGVELRRYYFPSLGTCSGLEQFAESPVSADIASRIVVLPIRPDLSPERHSELVSRVVEALSRVLRH